MKDKLTLITNEKTKHAKNKTKPVLVGEVKDTNVINVSFSGSKALRGYYSYECSLPAKTLALLYVIWYGKECNPRTPTAVKRRKFGEYLLSFVNRS